MTANRQRNRKVRKQYLSINDKYCHMVLNLQKTITYIERLSRLPQVQGRCYSGYSGLCGTASDAVDAVRSANPAGFKF